MDKNTLKKMNKLIVIAALFLVGGLGEANAQQALS
ncbi:MAG: hypothetical protein ACI93E_001176, partial [Flavobacteriales bacterium]